MLLDLYGSTPFPLALRLPLSDARAYFESNAYREHGKVREADQKVEVAIVDRLNGVIEAISLLGKALAGRRR